MKGKSMPPALDVLLGQLRARYGASPLPGFMRWWGKELLACVPAALRQRVTTQRTPLALSWPLAEPHGVPPGRGVTLLLAPGEALLCTLQLPRQAAANLRSVVGYELDKHTPFSADQLYFDVRAQAATTPGWLQVQLLVIPRARLDLVLQQAQAEGIQVVRVDALDAAGQPYAMNLMPAPQRDRQAQRVQRLRYGFGAAIGLLLVLSLGTWLGNREQALHAMEAEVAQLRGRALQVDAMRKQVLARAETERALQGQGSERQTSVALLNLLTTCLPADTWLEQLELRADASVRLSGASRQASSLPGQLAQCAGLTQASFQGGLQPDRDTGLERFTLVAQRRQPGA